MAGYLGNNPSDSSVRIARQIYTTSGVTTDFTFTSGYDPGYIDVYVNGERQTEGTNFTANDGSTVIILNGGVSTGSTVECAAYKTFNVATVTLGEVTDVDDLTITGAVNAGSGDIGIATIHSSGIDAGVGVITAATFSGGTFTGDGSALTGLASTDIINAEQVNVSGSTTTGIATVSTSIVVGSAVTVTATAININPTVTTTIGDSGNVDFNDDAKARFGTGNDLSIYHSGSHSFINDSGTGNLKILSSQVDILNPASNETIATFAENGAVALYYDNSVKLQTTTSGSYTTGIHTATSSLVAGDNADAGVDLRFRANRSSANQTIGNINGYWNDTVVGQIRFMAGEDTTNKDDCHLTFYTASAGTVAERLRIDSSGRLLLGTTTEGEVTAQTLTLASSSHAGITIRSGTSSSGSIYFSDGTSGADEYRGFIEYPHSSDFLKFGTNASERMRIDSSGRLLLGTTDLGDGAADNLTIEDSGNSGITIRSGASNNGAIFFSDGTAGNSLYEGTIQYDHTNNELYFRSAALIALTLDSSQNATFGGSVADSKGDLRRVPANTQTGASAYTLVAADSGKLIARSGGSVTIPNSVFTTGDMVTILNNSGSDITLTASVSTLYNSADASTGNRTLAGRGMATIYFTGATSAYISGSGLS